MMRWFESGKRFPILVMIAGLSLLGVQADGAGYPGRVLVKSNEVRWGQYKNIFGIRGLEFPNSDEENLADVLKEWPLSGASTVILRCQKPGVRFFSGDGSQVAKERIDQLRANIVATNAFDLLPLVLVFDPSVQCQLDSPEAYSTAAETLAKELGPDCWYLLCVTDQADHADWGIQDPSSDSVAGTLSVIEALKENHPDLIVGAGASSKKANQRLLEAGTPPDVLIGRVESLDLGEGAVSSKSTPVIETISHEALTEEDLSRAISKIGFRRIDESFPYGFAVLADKRGATVADFQETRDYLAEEMDRLQKETSNAMPPSDDMNAVLGPKEIEEGFVSLFNGKDLSGWVPITQPDNFLVTDGEIHIQKHTGGWIRSWERYDDYIFRGEYWIEEGGNSGIFMRAPLAGRCSRIGFEFQVMGQGKDAPITNDVTGSIYDVKPPEGVFIRPGEWNEIEIQLVGPEAKITWNGELAHHFKYSEVDAMKSRALAGYIGLQDHYDEVKFRNLRIKRLN